MRHDIRLVLATPLLGAALFAAPFRTKGCPRGPSRTEILLLSPVLVPLGAAFVAGTTLYVLGGVAASWGQGAAELLSTHALLGAAPLRGAVRRDLPGAAHEPGS